MIDRLQCVSVPEVARLLSVSETHVRTLISTGELPYRRLGRRLVVPRVELEAWLLDRTPYQGPVRGQQRRPRWRGPR